MAIEDAVTAALLVALAGALTLLSLATFRRFRTRAFLLLALGFAAVLGEAIVLSFIALGGASPGGLWLSVVAGAQVVALALIYAATFPRR